MSFASRSLDCCTMLAELEFHHRTCPVDVDMMSRKTFSCCDNNKVHVDLSSLERLLCGAPHQISNGVCGGFQRKHAKHDAPVTTFPHGMGHYADTQASRTSNCKHHTQTGGRLLSPRYRYCVQRPVTVSRCADICVKPGMNKLYSRARNRV